MALKTSIEIICKIRFPVRYFLICFILQLSVLYRPVICFLRTDDASENIKVRDAENIEPELKNDLKIIIML